MEIDERMVTDGTHIMWLDGMLGFIRRDLITAAFDLPVVSILRPIDSQLEYPQWVILCGLHTSSDIFAVGGLHFQRNSEQPVKKPVTERDELLAPYRLTGTVETFDAELSLDGRVLTPLIGPEAYPERCPPIDVRFVDTDHVGKLVSETSLKWLLLQFNKFSNCWKMQTPAVVAMLDDIQAGKPLMDSMEHVADSERELLGRIFTSTVGFYRGIRLKQIRDRFFDRFRYGTELPMFMQYPPVVNLTSDLVDEIQTVTTLVNKYVRTGENNPCK